MNRDLKIILGVLAAVFLLSLLYGLGRDAFEKFIYWGGVAAVCCVAAWICMLLPLQYVHRFLKRHGLHWFMYGLVLFIILMLGYFFVLKSWTNWAFPHHT